MQPYQNQSTFRQQIESKTFQYLQTISTIFQTHNLFFSQKVQLFNTIFNYFEPFRDHQSDQDQELPNFLQVTLNNESEKRLKRNLGIKQITEVSGSTKLFANIKREQMISSSKLQNFIQGPKSFFHSSSRNENKKVRIQIPPLYIPTQEEDILSCLSQQNDQPQNHRPIFENKKIYKIYTAQKKNQIISYRNEHGIKQACQKYEIPPQKINFWSRSLSKKKGIRGRKPVDPDMEERVCRWLKKQLINGTILTQKVIREKAKQISGSQQFKASKGWLEKFFKRRPQLFKIYTKNRTFGKQDRDEQIIKKQEQSSESELIENLRKKQKGMRQIRSRI